MTAIATIVCLVLALAVVVFAVVRYVRDQPADTPDVVVSGVLEVGVLCYVVVRVVDLARGHETSSLGLSIAYLIGIALVMPVAVLLGLAERSRWGPVVIGVGALVVCVLFARIDQVWTPGG